MRGESMQRSGRVGTACRKAPAKGCEMDMKAVGCPRDVAVAGASVASQRAWCAAMARQCCRWAQRSRIPL
eukprot:6212854-Pleurochrysis_carterae.AAC.1